MSFTSLALSAIPEGGYAYLAYDLEFGFRLLEQKVDQNAVYFRDLADLDADGVDNTPVSTTAMVINSKLVDLSSPFGDLENAAGSLIKVGDTWATIMSYNSAQSLTIDNHPARLPPIQSVSIANPGVIVSPGHGMTNDTPVKFLSDSLVPGGITDGTTYYTRNVTTDTYTIATAPGGTAIALTSEGLGQTYPSLLYSVYLPSFDADKINDTIIGKVYRQGSTYSMETYYSVAGTSSTPLEFVDGLPVAGNYEGQVVINTADNLIYTWNGTNWVTGTGEQSRSVKLSTTKQAFQYTSAGDVSGTDTATITAVPFNTTGTVTYGFKVDGGTYSQEGASPTFAYTARVLFDDMPDVIEVDMFENAVLVATDLITLFGVQQGSNAITIIVSNEAHTVPAQADGSAPDLTGSGTTVQVYKGATEIPFDDTVTYADPSFRVSAADTGVTAGSITGVGNVCTIADLTAFPIENIIGNLTLTITVVDTGETEYTKIQSFAKSLAGSDGSGGADAVAVKLTANDYSIVYASTGTTPAPTSFTLTGTAQGIDTPYYTFRIDDEAGTILQASSVDADVVITSPTNYFTPANNYWVGVSATDGGAIVAFDTITIFAVKPGTEAYTVIVFNEAHTVPADSAGTVSSYVGSGTEIEAYYGATQLTHTTGVPGAGEFNVTASGSSVTAGTITTVGSNASMAVASSLSAAIGVITLTINLENIVTTTKYQTLTKSLAGPEGADGADGADGVDGADGADGAAGLNAKAVNLTAAAQVVEYNSANNRVGPASILFTATPQNTSIPTYRFFVNDVAQGAASSTATFTYNTSATYVSAPVKIEVELYDNAILVARDQVSIYAIKPGSNVVTAILSNEAHTIPTDSAGNNGVYTGSGTTIKVYEGATQLTYETGTGFPTTNGRFRITTAVSNITVGAISGTGTTTATVAVASNMTQNTATITYTINTRNSVGQNLAVTKIQSFSKSVAGVAGIDGDDGTNGTNGVRGAGRWHIDVDPNALPTTSALANTRWGDGTFVGVNPGAAVAGDQAWFFTGTSAAPTGQSVWINSTGGTTWVNQTEVIDGNLLVTDTITANKMKLLSNSSRAINLSSDFSDTSVWYKSAGAGTLNWVTDATAPMGPNVLHADGGVQFSYGNGTRHKFPVIQGRTYSVSTYLKRTTGTATAYIRIYFYNEAGSLLQSALNKLLPTSTGTMDNISASATYELYVGNAVAPATATYCELIQHVSWNAAVGACNTYVSGLVFEEAIPAELVVDGSITADKMTVTSLSAISADMGTITAGTISSYVNASTPYMTITAGLISVYDAAGTLRVRLGVW